MDEIRTLADYVRGILTAHVLMVTKNQIARLSAIRSGQLGRVRNEGRFWRSHSNKAGRVISHLKKELESKPVTAYDPWPEHIRMERMYSWPHRNGFSSPLEAARTIYHRADTVTAARRIGVECFYLKNSSWTTEARKRNDPDFVGAQLAITSLRLQEVEEKRKATDWQPGLWEYDPSKHFLRHHVRYTAGGIEYIGTVRGITEYEDLKRAEIVIGKFCTYQIDLPQPFDIWAFVVPGIHTNGNGTDGEERI